MTSRQALVLSTVVLTVSGCASALVSDDAIAERTAFALGLSRADFTISNRSDEGASTRYVARTKTGQEFNCTVGVSVSVLGRQVTDAICNRKGEPSRNPLLR
jgi:hypothetical protein